MKRISIRAAAVAGLAATAVAAMANGPDTLHSRCAAKTNHSYGFQCHGWASVGVGLPLEPVTFLGTVSGSKTGEFNGTGTFNSRLGGARQRVSGLASFHDRACSGHIQYKVWLILPELEIDLPVLDIDFVTVGGGAEILGAPTALPGIQGDQVPRMVCRLVRSEGRD